MTGGNSGEEPATIVLPARVDSASAAEVERKIVDALRPGAQVIIDGQDVGYMSAAGVRMLATVLHRAEDQEAEVVFCRFNGAAADCLLVSGFAQLFDIAKTSEEARRRLKTKEPQPPGERLHAR